MTTNETTNKRAMTPDAQHACYMCVTDAICLACDDHGTCSAVTDHAALSRSIDQAMGRETAPSA